MPRLRELLELLARPGNEHLWVLLDIKVWYCQDVFGRSRC